MRIPCFFLHKYKLIKYWNYNDTSYDDKCPSHKLTWICENCKKVKTETFYCGGHLTDEEFEEMK